MLRSNTDHINVYVVGGSNLFNLLCREWESEGYTVLSDMVLNCVKLYGIKCNYNFKICHIASIAWCWRNPSSLKSADTCISFTLHITDFTHNEQWICAMWKNVMQKSNKNCQSQGKWNCFENVLENVDKACCISIFCQSIRVISVNFCYIADK